MGHDFDFIVKLTELSEKEVRNLCTSFWSFRASNDNEKRRGCPKVDILLTSQISDSSKKQGFSGYWKIAALGTVVLIKAISFYVFKRMKWVSRLNSGASIHVLTLILLKSCGLSLLGQPLCFIKMRPDERTGAWRPLPMDYNYISITLISSSCYPITIVISITAIIG